MRPFRFSHSLLCIIACAVLALSGALLINYVTQEGLGLHADSVTFLFAASNLAQGKGLLVYSDYASLRPLIGHQPLFPFILSLFFRMNLDPLAATRWMHMLLFAASVLLVAFGLRQIRPGSFWLPVSGALLFLLQPALWTMFQMAMSEPLFIFLSLASLVSLTGYLTKPSVAALSLSAVCAALSFLCRFSGLAVIIAGSAAILIFVTDSRSRAKALSLFLSISFLPAAAWLWRNWLVSSRVLSQEFIFHHQLRAQTFLWSFAGWCAGSRILVVFLAVLLAAALLMQLFPGMRRPAVSVYPLFIVSYCAILVFASLFLDASVQFNLRHTASLVPAVILAILGAWSVLALSMNRLPRVALVFFSVIALVRYCVGGLGFLPLMKTRAYQCDVSLVEKLRQLPGKSLLFTNDIAGVYSCSRMFAASLPQKYFASRNAQNAGFGKSMTRIVRLAESEPVFAVFFPVCAPERVNAQEAALYLPLKLLYSSGGNELYAVGK